MEQSPDVSPLACSWVGIFGRARALLRRRSLAALLLLAVLVGLALGRLPLLDVPGYELGAALTLLALLLGTTLGAAGARQERRLATDRGTCPPAADGKAALCLAFGASLALSTLAVAIPLAASVLWNALATPCSPWTSFAFCLLLPFPTALLACALGVSAGFATRAAWTAGLLQAGVVLASVLLSLWPLWAGPQVFFLDHFLGYFPGPLYDEALALEPRLWTFRALTVIWALLLLAACAALLEWPRARLRRRRPTAGLAFVIGALLALGMTGHGLRFQLGHRTDAAHLEQTLGGRSETEHFVLHFPAAKKLDDVRRLERDLEFAFDQVTRFFDVRFDGKVEAWFHPTPEEKRRLVGAAETSFAKPWLRQFHVHDEPFPHSIARHELAHVIAAQFGSPVFRVSARALLGINIGLVEGLATAADDRHGELTLHQWAAAMRRLKLAPDVRQIVGPAGFYRQPQARAYTLVGSFLRFLADRYGGARLKLLYPTGDFQAAYDKDLETLAHEWEQFLETVPLDERAFTVAQVRFERPSLFDRACGRELATLREQADRLRNLRPEESLELLRRCAKVEPGNPAHLRAQARLLRERERPAEAAVLLRRILALPSSPRAYRADALLELGDFAWQEGDVAEARRAFEQALALHRDRDVDRSLRVRLDVLDDPEKAAVLRRFFAQAGDAPELLALDEAATRTPEWATARYLVGRQLLMRKAPAAALAHLEAARTRGLGDLEVELENLRLLLLAHYLAGDCPGLLEAADALGAQGSSADQAFAASWRQRCEFETRAFGGPIKHVR